MAKMTLNGIGYFKKHSDNGTYYVARALEWPACITEGKTLKEAMEMLKDSIITYVNTPTTKEETEFLKALRRGEMQGRTLLLLPSDRGGGQVVGVSNKLLRGGKSLAARHRQNQIKLLRSDGFIVRKITIDSSEITGQKSEAHTKLV